MNRPPTYRTPSPRPTDPTATTTMPSTASPPYLTLCCIPFGSCRLQPASRPCAAARPPRPARRRVRLPLDLLLPPPSPARPPCVPALLEGNDEPVNHFDCHLPTHTYIHRHVAICRDQLTALVDSIVHTCIYMHIPLYTSRTSPQSSLRLPQPAGRQDHQHHEGPSPPPDPFTPGLHGA